MKSTLLALMMAACAFAQKPEKPLKNGLYANFKTEFGDVKAILFEKDTPQAGALFVHLAQGLQDFRDVDGKIVATEETSSAIIIALLDHRLGSGFSHVIYDVPSASPVNV